MKEGVDAHRQFEVTDELLDQAAREIEVAFAHRRETPTPSIGFPCKRFVLWELWWAVVDSNQGPPR